MSTNISPDSNNSYDTQSADTLFDTQDYNYPVLTPHVRDKIKQLRRSIDRLEANLITPESTDDDLASKENAESVKQHFANSPIPYTQELNPAQRLAATTISGKVLVIAGAGSGKTKTLTYRTSYLIERGASADSILVLTFTRKAANEIKARVQSLLSDTQSPSTAPPNSEVDDLTSPQASKSQTLKPTVNIDDISRITSGTFHSFCTLLLRRYAKLLGINPRFTILDTGDSEDALDLIVKEKKYPIKDKKQAFPRKKTLQTLISTSRNRRIPLHTLIENGYPDIAVHTPIIEQVAKDYHQYKRRNHLYDFDDIISQVVQHLKTNEVFRQRVQDRYRHVMVDEYQDTNVPQKQLIDYICAPKQTSLMVVGDDNQSIYAFRGANYENILLFGDSYPDAKLIKLEQNYRSTPAILDYVNALSQQITLGYQKQLFSDMAITGDKPQCCRRSNEVAEADFIAKKIIELKSEFDYADYAVLCRTSYLSNHIQIKFMEYNIPFIVVGGIKFVERRHIKDILAMVKVLYNPNDTIAWHRILTLFKGVGTVTATRLTQAITDNDNSLEPLRDPKRLKKNEQLGELYDVLTQAQQAESVKEIIELLEAFYLPLLTTLEENWRERAEDFRVLTNLAETHRSLEQFLENLALDPPNDSVATLTEKQSQQNDAVTISTIHSAKGLEWPVVFTPVLVDGLMPHYRSADDFEDMEEERKLFYVACSRAKRYLYLTAPDYVSSFSGYFDKMSRFVAEVPEHTVDLISNNGVRHHAANDPHKRGADAEEANTSNEPEWW